MTEAVALPTYGFRTLSENRWARFTVRRTGRLLVSLWVLVTAAFLMIHVIPGDPVRAALGPTAPPALVAQWREDLGLNLPLWEQYLNYLQGLFTGDLGTSIVSRVPVIDIIAQRLPATASLALLAFLAAVIVAVPLGVGDRRRHPPRSPARPRTRLRERKRVRLGDPRLPPRRRARLHLRRPAAAAARSPVAKGRSPTSSP